MPRYKCTVYVVNTYELFVDAETIDAAEDKAEEQFIAGTSDCVSVWEQIDDVEAEEVE